MYACQNNGPTMFHIATVRPKRWDPALLYSKALIICMTLSNGQPLSMA